MTTKEPSGLFKRFIESRLPVLLPAAAAAGLAFWQLTHQTLSFIQNLADYADRGKYILHGVSDKALSYSMPFFSLLNALAIYHWRGTPEPLILLAGFLVYLLCYSIGAAGGGPLRGIIFVISAACLGLTIRSTESEQLVYTLALLLYANAALLKLKKDNAVTAAAAGLALGVSLLVRSPLLLFPPAVIIWERFSGNRGPLRRFAVNSALFLCCSYILLLPWARLNYSLYGQFIPFEQERGSCNLITGAKGTVFTMEGDCRAYAGLTRTESVYAWAVKTVAAAPLNYAEAVGKRLWQAALMFPFLLLAAVAALFISRRRETRFLALLAGYFLFIHCLLSIEERYFYPLRYLLALIAAAGLFDALKAFWPGAERKDGGVLVFGGVFAVLAGFSFWISCKTLSWPGRAAEPAVAVERALALTPSDAWLHKKKGLILLSFNSTEGGLAALARYAALAKSPSPAIVYILKTLASEKPLPPDGIENVYDTTLVKALRELELNDMKAAADSFTLAQGLWERDKNTLKGLPYEKDRLLSAGIRPTNNSFWEQDLYSALYYFPLRRREAILTRLSSLTALTPKLEYLKLEAALENGKTAAAPGLQKLSVKIESELPSSEFNYNRQAGALTEALLEPAGPCAAKLPEFSALAVRAVETSLSIYGAKNTVNRFSADEGKTGWRKISLLYSAYAAKKSGQSFFSQIKALADAEPDNLVLFYLSACGGEGVPPDLGKRAYPLAAAASVFNESGRKDAALKLLGQAAEAAADADGLALAALAAQGAGDYALAHRLVTKALKGKPLSPELYNSRGVILRFSGKNPEAMADFKKALALDGRYFPAALNLASCLELAGNKPEALKIYSGLSGDGSLPREARETAAQSAARLKKR